MRALHVFPQFSPESINGSERYEYMLSRKLVELGLEVELLTTTTKDFVAAAPFCLQWPHQYTQSAADGDGILIRRFPATIDLPVSLGRFVSRRIQKRWKSEEARYGVMLKGSRNQIDYFHRRAIERPLIYDLMATLGRGPFSLGLLRNLVAAVQRCDVVQVGFTPFATTWQTVAIARLFRKPVVVLALFHPEDLAHHFRSIYWSFSAADAVLAQTAYSAAILKRLLPNSTPVDVGAGVNLDDLADGCGARFRGKYGLRNRKIVLLVGRKEYFKRYDLAIAAIELIRDQRMVLVMIGRDIDGRAITSGRVSFMGEVNHQDLIDAYDACDVFLLPSENESFGMVFLEAWARRKPVIGNRSCGPVACLIDEGENGYLSSTAEDMAGRIVQLIANPDLSRRLGQAGYDKVARRYTWDAIAAKVHELYAHLAAGGSKTRARI